LKSLKKGNKIVHHWDPNLAGAERIQRLQEELLCDVFLTSANAVTIDGTMVNIDGNGNRVAGMAWAAGKIIYVIGINKVCPGGLEAAIARVKNFATPPNAMRLNIKNALRIPWLLRRLRFTRAGLPCHARA